MSALLDAAPIAAESFDAHDNLPLHYAVEKGCSDVAVLEALVDACPQSAEVPSKDGETPIMISFRRAMLQAAASSSSSSFQSEREVGLLARLTGEALLIEDAKLGGNILLHQAVQRGAPVNILRLLVEACPTSATVQAKNDTGHHALMIAFAREQGDAGFPSAAEVDLLASAAGGGGALVADASGKICLHRAVEDGVPVDILEVLVKASPQSIEAVSSTGTTPLMAAIEGEASAEAVKALLVAAPSPNNVDRCIRHAIESGTPTDIVLLLADAMPVGTAVAEKEGDTALHHAIRHGAAVEVLEALVKASPESCLALNKDGQTPLHLKISQLAIEGKSIDVRQLRVLFDNEGRALLVQDHEGYIALHLAMASGAPIATLEALLNSAPSSIQIKDGRGRSALFHAIANGATDFVNLLIEKNPETLIDQDNLGLTPFNLAILYNSGGKLSPEYFEQLLGDEKAAKKIATLADADGKLPLHSSCQILELVPPEVILRLLELNPKSPSTKTASGELPIDLVESKRKYITNTEDVEYLNSVSDLLFSFHPNVLPYRADLDRLQRFRSRILTELSKEGALSDESRRFWIWLCTIPDRNDGKMHYRNTIESILKSVQDVEMQKVLQTVEIDVPGGDRAPLYKCVSERIVLLLAPPHHDVTTCLKEVGESIRQSHSRGFIHGNVSSFKISRMMEGGYEVSNVASASHTQLGDYIGASSSLVSTGGISPTMVASLGLEGYVKYRKYWKTVHDDALTQLIVNQLDVSQLTDMVHRYLPKKSTTGATLGHLLDRFCSNSKLWKIIRPRRSGSKVYVVKCFYENPATGFPLSPGRLPYELVQASGGYDLWSFGLVLHESLVGSPLIAVDALNNLASGTQYASLHKWTKYGQHIVQVGGKAVKDPVAADLLQRLLRPDTYTSTASIDRILEHPFFLPPTSASARKLCLNILANEKERREIERLETEKKRRQEEKERDTEKAKNWMAQRTEVLDTVSMKARLKFEASTWKQWGVEGESLLPTSFVLLPYRLEASAEGHLSVSAEDAKAAQQLGSSLAGILRYVQLLTDMTSSKYRSKKNPAGNAIWRFNETNKHIDVPETTTFLGCCRDIVTRADNAKDLLCSLLPSGEDKILAETASLLIHTHIKSIVDIDECRDVVVKADAANAAMQALVAISGGNTSKSVHQVMGEQYDELLGVTSLREQQAEKRQSVEQALTNLVEDFSEDALGTVEKLLSQKVAGLCSTYMFSRRCYLYMVDEFTGIPAKELAFRSSTTYPLSIDTSTPNELTVLLPCMLPTVKEACYLNTVTGLASLLGIQAKDIPLSWSDIANVSPRDLGTKSTKRECKVLHSIISYGEVPSKMNQGDETDLFQKYCDIILSRDVRRDFGGMKRIKSPLGDFLWSSEIRGDVEEDMERAEVHDFLQMTRAEQAEKAKAIMEGSAPSQGSSVDSSNRSVYERVFRTTDTTPVLGRVPGSAKFECKSTSSIATYNGSRREPKEKSSG